MQYVGQTKRKLKERFRECKYVGCSLALDSLLELIIPILRAKRLNLNVYFDCISQSSSAL